MALVTINKTDDGVEVTGRRLEKQIVVSGQLITMFSLDGVNWLMDRPPLKDGQTPPNEKKAARMLTGAQNLAAARAARTAKKDAMNKGIIAIRKKQAKEKFNAEKVKEFDARLAPGIAGDPKPKIVNRYGYVKQRNKGKQQKYRKNLREPVPTDARFETQSLKGAKRKKVERKRDLLDKRGKQVEVYKTVAPVHYHQCPDFNHPAFRRRFSCSCDRPKAKFILCGGSKCLRTTQSS
jgi:hypothetical protein